MASSPTARSEGRLVYLEAAPPEEEDRTDFFDLVNRYYGASMEAKWYLAATLLCCLGLALALTFYTTPTYRSTLTIEVQGTSDEASLRANQTLGGGAADIRQQSYLETQVKVLESRRLRREAVALVRDDETGWLPLHKNKVLAWKAALARQFPAIFDEPAIETTNELPGAVVEISIVRGTRILQIETTSPDPRFAAVFGNALAQAYLSGRVKMGSNSRDETLRALNDRLDGLRRELEQSEHTLQEYSSLTGLVSATRGELPAQTRLEQVEAEAWEAEADRVRKQALFEIASAGDIDAIPVSAGGDRLREYQGQLEELRRSLAELRTTFTPEHFKVKRVEAQITHLEGTISKEKALALGRIENDYQAAARRERMLKDAQTRQVASVSTSASQAIRQGLLQREVDTNREIYDTVLAKIKEVSVLSSLSIQDAAVLDAAEPAIVPYRPSLITNTILGLVTGLMCCVGIVFVRQAMDRQFRAPGEVPAQLRIPELGVIPHSGVEPIPVWENRKTLPALLPKLFASGNGAAELGLMSWQSRDSVIAESFRTTMASILARRKRGDTPKIIMVSSANRREGKSTITSNLAIALAEVGYRVLVVDADIRRPTQNKTFNVANSWGLSSIAKSPVLVAHTPVETLVKETEVDNLFILPSGPGASQVSALLYSEQIVELFEVLRGAFDFVLVDTPPALGLSDARAIGRLTDGAILVLSAGSTTRGELGAVNDMFRADTIPVLGVVLNNWDGRTKMLYGYDWRTFRNGESA